MADSFVKKTILTQIRSRGVLQ
ncbi:hypothetical protein CCACVL1_13338 [Corchorus capsularis]|uniref:Uncharacterized protein n=1 Tax=Corchorus capsularis TaxID=210143 RepID=A0A1R3IBA4_COCAP|nr:hypothetical protein CCACVL1_13338 [Corchorus capsularis]